MFSNDGKFLTDHILVVVALGQDAAIEYLCCETDADRKVFCFKWFGSETPTLAECKRVVLNNG